MHSSVRLPLLDTASPFYTCPHSIPWHLHHAQTQDCIGTSSAYGVTSGRSRDLKETTMTGELYDTKIIQPVMQGRMVLPGITTFTGVFLFRYSTSTSISQWGPARCLQLCCCSPGYPAVPRAYSAFLPTTALYTLHVLRTARRTPFYPALHRTWVWEERSGVCCDGLTLPFSPTCGRPYVTYNLDA